MQLHITLEKLVVITGGTLHGTASNSFLVERLASLEKATSSDLAVILERGDASVFDAVQIEKINNSKAGFFLSSDAIVPERVYVLVPNAVVAFDKLVKFFAQQAQEDFELVANGAYVSKHAHLEQDVIVGPCAVISSGARIGSGCVIGAQVFVGRDCVIGPQVFLHPGVKILDGCAIGDYSIIHSGTVIGSDGFGYKVNKTGMQKIPHIGIVVIGKFVEIGANCSVDRALFDTTRIGDGVKIDNSVHIAHNVVIGQGTAILAQTGIAGSSVIGAGCQIGGQVAIKNDLNIGNFVKIVSKSGVLNNIADGQTVAGVPAIEFGLWKRTVVAIQRLPDLIKKTQDLMNRTEKRRSCTCLNLRKKTSSFFKRFFKGV